METVAANYLRSGDIANAATMYTSLEKLNQKKYGRMARLLRVLENPASVPLPHRHNDICEALLEPSLPPEFLIGDAAGAEQIQKRYQKMVLLVHPDKNPHPKAKDAFLRLGSLRDEAVAILERRQLMERLDRQRNPQPSGAASPSGSSSPKASPPLSHLSQLKNQKIKLQSLRRKDLTDADLEELTATQRPTRSATCGDGDFDDEERLASTVPQMPSNFFSGKVNPPPARAAKRPPPPAARAAGARKSKPEQATTAPGSPTTAPLPKKATKAARAPPPPPDPAEDARVEEVREADTAPAPSPPSHLSPLTTTPQGAVAAAGGADGEAAVPIATMGQDDVERIRQQINEMIEGLGRMRERTTRISLTCDLSYDAYMNDKKKQ